MARLMNFAKDIDPEFSQAGIERARALGPVTEMKLPIIGKVYLTTTHEAATALLTSSDRFVSEAKNAGKSGTGLPFPLPKSMRYLMDGFIQKDEPDHRRMRSFVDKAFAKQSVTDLKDASFAYAQRQADVLEGNIRANGSTDYIEDFSSVVPMQIISVLLGFPEDMQRKFLHWMRPLRVMETTPWGMFRMMGGIRKAGDAMDVWTKSLVGSDHQGLIAELVNAQEGDDRLNAEEMKAIVVTLVIAGAETTTHLLNAALWYLVQHPDMADRLRQQPEDTPAFVEELLRWFCPLVTTKPRFSATTQEFYGVEIPQGKFVMPSLLAANTDPAVFDDPWTFDIDRPNKQQHMAFGSGIHNCLGRPLVRVEADAALRVLLQRLPEIRPAQTGQKPWYKFKNTVGRRSMKFIKLGA